MDEQHERRRSMDREIAGLKELLTQRFDGTDERLDALTAQVKETNGRVRTEEAATADFRPRIRTLEREMAELRKPEAGDRRGIRVWDVSVFVATVGLTITVLKLLGKL